MVAQFNSLVGTTGNTTKYIATPNDNGDLYIQGCYFSDFSSHTANGGLVDTKRIISHQGLTRQFQQDSLVSCHGVVLLVIHFHKIRAPCHTNYKRDMEM